MKYIAAIFIILLIASQAIPFFMEVPQGSQYMGIPYNVVDTNNYFSFMQQASEGKLLFTNKFTSEPVPYIFAQPLFLIMGWLSVILSPVLVYYLFKFAFVFVFAFLIYVLLTLAFKEKEIPIGALFVLFGSGIGYIFLVLGKLNYKLYGSIDNWLMESNSIGLNLAPVHFIVSVCLMLAVVLLYHRFWEEKRIALLALAAVFTLILGFIHLFDVITLAPVFGIYMLWRLIEKKESIKTILKFNIPYALIVAIPFIYTYYIFAINPLFIEWDVQNVLGSPPIQNVIFGYLIPFILAIFYFGYKFVQKKKFTGIEVMLFAWMLAGVALLYSPLNIQRRFIEGLHIPILILGALGFLRFVLPIAEKCLKAYCKVKYLRPIMTTLVFLIITPTSFYWLYKVNEKLPETATDYNIPVYLSQAELDAMSWLKENTDGEAVVLSSYASGNYIPRISGNRVYLGHWAQTIRFEDRKEDVMRFYEGNDNKFNSELLAGSGIDYVYYGGQERKIGQLDTSSLLRVFENGGVTIYQVT